MTILFDTFEDPDDLISTSKNEGDLKGRIKDTYKKVKKYRSLCSLYQCFYPEYIFSRLLKNSMSPYLVISKSKKYTFRFSTSEFHNFISSI